MREGGGALRGCAALFCVGSRLFSRRNAKKVLVIQALLWYTIPAIHTHCFVPLCPQGWETMHAMRR